METPLNTGRFTETDFKRFDFYSIKNAAQPARDRVRVLAPNLSDIFGTGCPGLLV